jgi:hypothetical protein
MVSVAATAVSRTADGLNRVASGLRNGPAMKRKRLIAATIACLMMSGASVWAAVLF